MSDELCQRITITKGVRDALDVEERDDLDSGLPSGLKAESPGIW